MRNTLVLWIVLHTGLIAAAAAPAQDAAVPAAAASTALSDRLPVDPEITLGKFDNGLQYCIRVNHKPENRAELRLVVNAGSLLEADDQRGLAHFLEHMAFNGTKHFAKQEIVTFMQSIGMRFGPSLNAFTSFDETVYMLQIPTDKPEVMDKAFLILEDWAHNLSFDPEEIDKERGVIIEEWRLRRGAGARIQDKLLPVMLKGSRYAERLPIGETSVIQDFKHERLREFYRDWYRPDLMSVIAVGDFDKAAVERLINEHFAMLPLPAKRLQRTTYGVPDHPETLYAVATDKEATTTSVAAMKKLPVREQDKVDVYRAGLVEQLYTGMLNRRFTEIAQKTDAPFLMAGSQRGALVRSKDAFSLSAVVKEGGTERGLDALFTESERVARFGFTATELDREKRDMLRGYERAFAERQQQESSRLAAEYVRHFTAGEPIPGIAFEYGLAKRFVPEITLEEVNALGRKWAGESNRVVTVSGPEKPEAPMPDPDKLAAVVKAALAKEVKPYVDTAANQPLLDTLPASGSVVDTKTLEPFGITEWTLSNGVKVVLKPTTFKQDEIVFRAFSPGGTSLASDQDYVPASTASQVVAAGGLGKFSAIELQKILAGKAAAVRPFIGDTSEGVAGSASPKDLETMFQLIYATFTKPRADPAIFEVLTSRTKAMLANRAASPDFVFQEALQTTLSQNHPRARPMTPEMVDEMNLEKSFQFYKERFADAGDFTFVFLGSFDPDAMKPLVERYLASLPSTGRSESWRDVGMEPPKGVVRKTVVKGIEPKSRTAIVFTGPFRYEPAQRVRMRALSLLLESKLRETLREELGGTYSVGVSASYEKIPRQEYSFSISFSSNPERTDELIQAVFREIEAAKAAAPEETRVMQVRQALLREHETNMKQNGFLLNQIAYRYELKENLKDLFTLPELYESVSAGMLQEAAREYLNTGNYVQVTLMPEGKKP